MKVNTQFVYNRTVGEMVAQRSLENGGRVQRYIDSTVLRLSDPYVPYLSGQLKLSGIRGTVIGKGEVVYNSPYARRQYYNNRGSGKEGTSRGGLRGRYWFERMKADRLDEILDGAAKIAGGVGTRR